jgi:hypothetical protein
MSGGINWERRRPVPHKETAPGGFSPTAKQTFEALTFYVVNPEGAGAGNFVVIPGNWSSMSEPELHARRVFHRRRNCAQSARWFNRAAGDRWVRIRNESVVMYGLQGCDTCAAHVRMV